MSEKRDPRPNEPIDLYFKTPHNLIDTPEWEQLSASARYLYYHLWYLFNKHAWTQGTFTHSDEQIAQGMKRSRKTIWTAKQELIKHGFITYTYNKNHNANQDNKKKLAGKYYMLGAQTDLVNIDVITEEPAFDDNDTIPGSEQIKPEDKIPDFEKIPAFEQDYQ